MKDDRIYLTHIAEGLKTILMYVEHVDYVAFMKDRKTQDACIRQFEVIGEATKRLSSDFRQRFPQVQWKYLAKMRDKLIHDYIDVDLEIVWQTISVDVVPTLIKIEFINTTIESGLSDQID